jgi:hypothetical protein
MPLNAVAEKLFVVECSLHGSYKILGNYKIDSCIKCDYEKPVKAGKFQVHEVKTQSYLVKCSLHGLSKVKSNGNRITNSCPSCDCDRPFLRGKLQVLELSG